MKGKKASRQAVRTFKSTHLVRRECVWVHGLCERLDSPDGPHPVEGVLEQGAQLVNVQQAHGTGSMEGEVIGDLLIDKKG